MTLLHARGGWLYEHRPDLFPEGQMTDTEIELWSMFYKEREQRGR